MFNYILRRLGQSFIVLLLVMLITFTLPYFEVGGLLAPAYAVLGTHANPHTIHLWGVQHGMFRPYFVRFWEYIDQVFIHFNLGHSYKQNLSVWAIISIYVPRTLWLALTSLILTVIIALPLGIYQASKRNTTVDYIATGTAFVLYGIPAFLLGILMLQFFSFGWPHLPTSPPNGVAPWAMFTESRRLYPARANPHSLEHRLPQSLYAQRGTGSSGAGLRADRDRQGLRPAPNAHSSRLSQRPRSHRDHPWSLLSGAPGRRRRHRGCL